MYDYDMTRERLEENIFIANSVKYCEETEWILYVMCCVSVFVRNLMCCVFVLFEILI